jgi:hypothetical protein
MTANRVGRGALYMLGFLLMFFGFGLFLIFLAFDYSRYTEGAYSTWLRDGTVLAILVAVIGCGMAFVRRSLKN